MCATRLTEPRLQTAISVSLVLSVISVHRFELCTVPRCCCGERTLQASLNVIHGCPVSNSIDSILRHSWTRGDLLVQLELAARRALLVAHVGFLERAAPLVVQVGDVGRREQRPVAAFHHPLHEQVRNPVRGVHVVGAAAVVAGVLAQLEELLDVEVPGLEVGAHGALALAALVDRDGGVVDDLEEGHHALALAVGALDVRAHRADVGPVVAEPAGELGQQRVLLDRLVDAVEVVGDRREVARRQLRAVGARVEQRRRRAHEVEGRQHVVELDRARLAVDLVQREAHRDAHEEALRQLEAAAGVGVRRVLVDEEIAVVERLQAEVAELQVALGLQRRAELLHVVLEQRLVEEADLDAVLDEAREVLGDSARSCRPASRPRPAPRGGSRRAAAAR